MRADLILLAALLPARALGAPAAEPSARWSASSPLALSPDGRWLAAANPESGTVTLRRTGRLEKGREIAVGRAPRSVCFTPDGGWLIVANHGSNDLSIIRVGSRKERVRVPTGAMPSAVVADGRRVFVAEAGAGTVASFDLESRRLERRVSVGDFPEALALSPDGKRLLVSRLRSGRLTLLGERLAVQAEADLGPNASLAHSIAVSPDGRRAYIPHTVVNASDPALNFDTMIVPVVSVVALPGLEPLPAERLLLATLYRGSNRPSGAVVSPDGARLYVANAGSGDVAAVDPRTGDILAQLEVGADPRGLALSPDGSRLFVSNALDGTLSVVLTGAASRGGRGRTVHPPVPVSLLGAVSCRSCHASADPAPLGSDVRVELAAGKLEVPSVLWSVDATLALTRIPLDARVLKGKRLFHSASLSRERWISCATCHPDGGTDGRTWAGHPDGPRNTPPLFGCARTLPMDWSGGRPSLHGVAHTVTRAMFGRGLLAEPGREPQAGMSEDLDALVAYLASLEAPPSPFRAEPAALERGKAAFEKAGCASCHPAPLYTDRELHDVGTGVPAREKRGTRFDTPSLNALWLSAPYFHDGSAPTLEDALRSGREHDVSGRLDAEETRRLLEFLRSL